MHPDSSVLQEMAKMSRALSRLNPLKIGPYEISMSVVLVLFVVALLLVSELRFGFFADLLKEFRLRNSSKKQ
jgi:hypothetical protein